MLEKCGVFRYSLSLCRGFPLWQAEDLKTSFGKHRLEPVGYSWKLKRKISEKIAKILPHFLPVFEIDGPIFHLNFILGDCGHNNNVNSDTIDDNNKNLYNDTRCSLAASLSTVLHPSFSPACQDKQGHSYLANKLSNAIHRASMPLQAVAASPYHCYQSILQVTMFFVWQRVSCNVVPHSIHLAETQHPLRRVLQKGGFAAMISLKCALRGRK